MRSCGFRKFWVCRSGNSDHLTRRSLDGAGRVKAEVLGADRRPIELEPATPLQDAIDDGLGEILVVEHAAPGIGMLVAGEDHRAAAAMAGVDDVVEHVGRVGAVGEIADLVELCGAPHNSTKSASCLSIARAASCSSTCSQL